MKEAPTDEVAEAVKKGSGDPKPFDIFAGLQGEPVQSNSAPSATPTGFDVFSGMKSLDSGSSQHKQSAPQRSSRSQSENRRLGVFIALFVVVLVIGIIIGTRLAR